MRKNSKKILTLAILIVVVIVIILLCLRSCGSNTPDPGETTEPSAATVDTTLKETDSSKESSQPVAETTAPTEPEETVSPATEASATEPSATEPPATEAPKATEPPATEVPTTESPKVEHTHNFSSTTKEATCTADGYATYVCGCGYSYTEVIKATGHDWSNWSVTTQPTAEAEGIESRKCGVCGTTETRCVAKLPAETNPPATEPPATEPPKQEPVATESPTTDPPATEPAVCIHTWVLTDYQNEEGHNGPEYCVCHCGSKFNTTAEWGDHIQSFDPLVALNDHGHYWIESDWIVDTPGWNLWVCEHCGEELITEPCIYPGVK